MSDGTTEKFFEQQKEKSRIKTMIVTDFFKAYFQIINYAFNPNKVYYIDLFCGPGKYEDGTPSTPIALLDVVRDFENNDIRDKLALILNDKDPVYVSKLRGCVYNHEVCNLLKYRPVIMNLEASKVDISNYVSRSTPAFSFIDPFGYIDVSARQIWTLVKNAGSDCVLFFNTDRILRDIGKPSQEEYFRQIFEGELETAKEIHLSRDSQKAKCEKFLMLFAKVLYKKMNQESFTYSLYTLPFRIEADDKNKTSHYIVFISKSHKAIEEMKKVMLNHSNNTEVTFSFDSKDSLLVSLFSREDNLNLSILNAIRKLLRDNPQYLKYWFTVPELMETMDKISMQEKYQVFPYLVSELKDIVDCLHKKGYIDIETKPNEKIRKAITLKRRFKFNDRILEIK